MQVLVSSVCASKFQPPTSFSSHPAADPQQGIGSELNPKKILVVDDEKDLADISLALLGLHGLNAVVAYSASDALLILEADPEIDAVFSDIRMPGMSGIELAEVMRRRFPHIKVLLTSGYAPPSWLAGYSKAHEIVVKPYDVADVVKRLRE